MNLLNIGIPEILLLLVLMLILLGPERMNQNARALAQLIQKIVKSETWRDFSSVYREVRNYPARIMHETQLAEIQRELDLLNADAEKRISKIQKDLSQRNLEDDNPEKDVTTEDPKEKDDAGR